MFDLPKSTEIKKIINKKQIYQKFATELSKDNKAKFDADISKITVINEISEASVNIKATEKVPAMFVVQIELKAKDYNDSNLIFISKYFGQKLLLLLHYEDEYQSVIYETKLLKSEWKSEEEISLKLNGLDLSAVWDSFVTQVSGIEAEEGNTLDEQIAKEAEKEKLLKKIKRLKAKACREIQSKKQFELFQQIKQCQRKLEEY